MKYTISIVSSNVNCRIWVMIMCQYSFTTYNKCTTVVCDIKSLGSYVYGGRRQDICVLSIFSTQSCYESKTALKIKFIDLNNKKLGGRGMEGRGKRRKCQPCIAYRRS